MTDVDFFYFSSLIFKENHFCIEEDNPQEKLIIVVQEQDGICIADTEKLENLPRLVFIDNECGNANVVVDGRELTRNITKKRISIVLKAYRSPLCDKCDKWENSNIILTILTLALL